MENRFRACDSDDRGYLAAQKTFQWESCSGIKHWKRYCFSVLFSRTSKFKSPGIYKGKGLEEKFINENNPTSSQRNRNVIVIGHFLKIKVINSFDPLPLPPKHSHLIIVDFGAVWND
jgi:hypothetical protein